MKFEIVNNSSLCSISNLGTGTISPVKELSFIKASPLIRMQSQGTIYPFSSANISPGTS